jgi:hypothetical protein
MIKNILKYIYNIKILYYIFSTSVPENIDELPFILQFFSVFTGKQSSKEKYVK